MPAMYSRLTAAALVGTALQVIAQDNDTDNSSDNTSDNTTEDNTSDNTTEENASDNATTEENATDNATTEENATDNATTEENASDNATTEENATENATTEENASDNATTEENATENATANATENATVEVTANTTSMPTVPIFVAPTPATPVPTSADTTAFELTLVTGCSDCRSQFNENNDPTSAFTKAYETMVASNMDGVKEDDVDALLKLIKTTTRVEGDKINAALTIAQENMDASTKKAISSVTTDTFTNTDALTALLPEGAKLTMDSIKVDEITGSDTTTTTSSSSSSVQIGSALSFLCTLLWLIK